LAIHDDIFAAEPKDIEHVDWIEIPPHMTDIRLEVKDTKLDLPIFRRPARPVNEYRTSIMIGLLRALCGEADGDAIT
jgi:hypothetical protein